MHIFILMICTQLALIEYCLDCLQFNILLFYAEVCLVKSALIIVEIAMPYVLLCGSECSTFFLVLLEKQKKCVSVVYRPSSLPPSTCSPKKKENGLPKEQLDLIC